MKKFVFYLMFSWGILLLYNCEEAPSLTNPPANYLTFEANQATVSVELNGAGSYDLKVFSTNIENNARTYSVTVDESSTASASSYNVPSTVEIPSGVNEGILALSFVDGEISNSGETLVLNLVGNENVSVGGAITVNIIRNCPSNLEGNYVYANGNPKEVTVERVGETSYVVSADNAFNADYPFDITDTCNEITITGGSITTNFGLAVSGNGTVDSDSGTITLYYNVEGNLENWEMILVKQ